MRSTSVVLFFCPLCFVLTVLNITLLSCQAWDGWTPPVTTSIASKALSIKDHAFAPAAGTAEVAGWTPVTSVATVAASSLSAHSSGECSMGSVSKGLSIKDHAFVPAAGATGWRRRAGGGRYVCVRVCIYPCTVRFRGMGTISEANRDVVRRRGTKAKMNVSTENIHFVD